MVNKVPLHLEANEIRNDKTTSFETKEILIDTLKKESGYKKDLELSDEKRSQHREKQAILSKLGEQGMDDEFVDRVRKSFYLGYDESHKKYDESVLPVNTVKDEAESQKESREKDLMSYGSDTARDEYNKASEKDKAYLRKITKYENGSMILMTPEGKELFRSYGMLKPTALIGQNSFKKQEYSNGVGKQTNIEAKWKDWFEAENRVHNRAGNYSLKTSVLKAIGMDGNITAGEVSQWNTIYKLFSPIKNKYGNEETKGMQVARAMMGITGLIWTNEKNTSVFARRCILRSENCHWSNDVIEDGYNMSAVGLENLQHRE